MKICKEVGQGFAPGRANEQDVNVPAEEIVKGLAGQRFSVFIETGNAALPIQEEDCQRIGT